MKKHQSARAKVIGLSGGIASGKTTVAQMFEALGAAVINADEIAHEVVQRPEVRAKIVRRWGGTILKEDGSLDRQALAVRVFADAKELRALEGMTHPAILREIERRIRRHRAGKAPLIVLDAPLLNEARLDRVCDAQVFVAAKTAQRCARSWRERRWTGQDLARREAQQMTLDAKRRRATYVIDNSATRGATGAQVRALWKALVPGSGV
jgi:dephospho-CoA kinase